MKNNPNKQIRNTVDSETPFQVIEARGKNGFEIRLYWTQFAGTYGHQVVTQMWTKGQDGREGAFYDITTGVGYCKRSTATYRAMTHAGVIPRGMQGAGQRDLDHKYHVGGNYYRVPAKDLVKLKK